VADFSEDTEINEGLKNARAGIHGATAIRIAMLR
jgi:hypothetical protein